MTVTLSEQKGEKPRGGALFHPCSGLIELDMDKGSCTCHPGAGDERLSHLIKTTLRQGSMSLFTSTLISESKQGMKEVVSHDLFS